MKKQILLCLLTLVVGLAAGLCYNFLSLSGTGLLRHWPMAPLGAANATGVSSPPTAAPEESGSAQLLRQGGRVLEAIKRQDYQTLSQLVHPERGVTFTPFSTVDQEGDLTFTAGELAGAADNHTLYVWGISTGVGDPIELTLADYFARYVFPVDYTAAPLIGINHVSATGNSLENVAEAYPQGLFLEYYFPGQEGSGGLDWSALKLVFESYEGRLCLVGIIHSEWTI